MLPLPLLLRRGVALPLALRGTAAARWLGSSSAAATTGNETTTMTTTTTTTTMGVVEVQQPPVAPKPSKAAAPKAAAPQGPPRIPKVKRPHFVVSSTDRQIELKPWNKVWFPNERVVLVKPAFPDHSAKEVVIRCPPHMSKHDIKEFMTKVYGFSVARVDTAIYASKLRRSLGDPGTNKFAVYRQPRFKKAWVTLNQPGFARPSADDVRARIVGRITSRREFEP